MISISTSDNGTHVYGAVTSSTATTVATTTAAAALCQQNEEEIKNPWPATFQRSVAILSKPILDKELVAFASESIHILPPTKLKRNTSLSDLNRGWRTPDPSPESKWVEKASRRLEEEWKASFGSEGEEEGEEHHDDVFERMGLTRTLTMPPSQKPQQQLQITMPRTKEYYGPKGDDDTTDMEKGPGEKTSSSSSPSSIATKATLRQCIFNVANTLMGMGIISLPFCLRSAGWAGGLSILIVFGGVTGWTSVLIGRVLNGDPRSRSLLFKNDAAYDTETTTTTIATRGDVGNGAHRRRGGDDVDVVPAAAVVRLRRQLTSFPDIAREAFGQKSNIALSSLLYFELFSALSVFFVSLGDHLHSLIPSISTTRHMIACAVLLVIPTVVCKTPRLLSYLSAVGTFTTVSLVLSVFVAAVWEGDISDQMVVVGGGGGGGGVTEAIVGTTAAGIATTQQHQSFHTVFIPTGLPIALGLVAYCFGGHAVVPTIYNSMAQPRDYERVIGYSYVLVMTCCIMVSTSGYYMFGSTVSDQVTLSLERAPIDAESAMRVLTWLMVVTSLSKFTLYLFPLALGVEEIIAPYVSTDQVMELSFMVIKLGCIVVALFVGICIPSFAFLCSVIGLICTVTVSVIFPAAAHLKLFGPHLKFWEKCVDYLFVLGGLAVAIFGTIATVGSFNE